MWFATLIKGVIIGLLASIPLGPIGVLCIQRTLSKNHKAGFVSGLGASTADALFAAIALFALSAVLPFIESHISIIKGVGGACILAVGINIFLTNPVVQIRRNRAGKTNLVQDFISMFLITLANPAFIFIFVALFAAFGISTSTADISHRMTMILGVWLGSALWWFSLTLVINTFRQRFRPRHMLWINRISGSVICLLGIITVLLIFIKSPLDGILF